MGLKIGDTVRVCNSLGFHKQKYSNKMGIIVGFWTRIDYKIVIEFDDITLNTASVGGFVLNSLKDGHNIVKGDLISGHVFKENEVIKPVKATKLAKKMYPDKTEENGWLI